MSFILEMEGGDLFTTVHIEIEYQKSPVLNISPTVI